jgi:hypothetical protein
LAIDLFITEDKVPPSAHTRTFQRTDIGPREQAIGGGILVLLVAVGVTIAIKGSRYDPAIYTGDVGALESTRQSVDGKAATLRADTDLRAFEQSGAAAGPGPSVEADKVIPALVGLLAPMGPTEIYSEETLFEKINGRAPAYFEYNFQELTSRSFTIEGMPGEFIDVYLFRMADPLNAYGIFTAERDATGSPVAFVEDGYRSEMGVFMRVGDVYAQLLASSTTPAVMKATEAFSRRLATFLPQDNSGMEGRSLLPAENRIPGSLTYINENAYGQAVLKQVFEAQYAVDGKTFTLFAQTNPDTVAAQSNWETLRGFYEKYGTVEEPEVIGMPRLFIGEMFGEWSLIYSRENAVSGIMNATDKDAALAFLLAQTPSTSDYSSGY